MAEQEYVVFTPHEAARLKRLVLAYERGELNAKPVPGPALTQGWARIERFRLTEAMTAGSAEVDARCTRWTTGGTWADVASSHPFYAVTLRGGTTSMSGDSSQPVWAVMHRQSQIWWILQKDCPA